MTQETHEQRSVRRTQLLAACVAPLLLLLAAVLVRPLLNEGVNDDWSYTKSAQVLAATGHIVYTGWTSPMLGWQLFLADGFIHLFGFSFDVVRLSMLPVALLTSWLAYWCFVRCGIRAWSAALGACALSLSPVALPLTFTFMTDISGLFVLVLCVYCCLRTLAAEGTREAVAWLAFAVIGNAIGGTVRQIAWLGVLVLVPSLLWLVRRRRVVLVAGLLLETAAILFVVSALLWFRRQPFTLAEPLFPHEITAPGLAMIRGQVLRAVLELPFLLLPVLIGFVPAVPWRQRRVQAVVAACGLAGLVYGVLLARHGKLWLVVQPTLGNVLSRDGILNLLSTRGPQPRLIPAWVGGGCSVLAAFALLSAACVLLFRPARRQEKAGALRSSEVLRLLLPFLLAYAVLLIPRAAEASLFDRYLLEVLFVCVLGLLLLYQHRVGDRPSGLAVVCTALFALVAIAWTHDRFAQSRAELAAIREVEATGVPASQISGGFAFNGWNELAAAGYVADRRRPGQPPSPQQLHDPCLPMMAFLTPHLERHFALATEPTDCAGPTGFAPASYTAWLPPGTRRVYVVRDKPLP